MESTEIRPDIFAVLEKEVSHRSSKETAEKRLNDLCKSITSDINRKCESEIVKVREEIRFAQLILEGLYSPEGTDMHRIAEGYVTGDATPGRKK